MYQDFLDNKLPRLLKDVGLEVPQNMWFQYNITVVRLVISTVARAVELINWSARLLDLTLPGFCFVWYQQLVRTPLNESGLHVPILQETYFSVVYSYLGPGSTNVLPFRVIISSIHLNSEK
ncbi:hypothetical protein Trydic_g6496 [Trypoxylus dichotomus]